MYYEAGVGHLFDAAVLQRGDDGKVKVVDKHEQSTRHGAWKGLAIGAGIGAVTGHIKNGMSNDDLKELGTLLENGEAGLIVLYATNMADQVAAIIKAENRYVSAAIDADADELARQLKGVKAAELETSHGGTRRRVMPLVVGGMPFDGSAVATAE
jgi:uncharacterized membrane protein